MIVGSSSEWMQKRDKGSRGLIDGSGCTPSRVPRPIDSAVPKMSLSDGAFSQKDQADVRETGDDRGRQRLRAELYGERTGISRGWEREAVEEDGGWARWEEGAADSGVDEQ